MEEKITLCGKEVSLEELEEKRKNLSSDERIVETSPGTFEILVKLEG